MNVQICYLQACSSQINNFQFSLYKCVSYDGQCIVMNVLQLFRLNIACVKKLFCWHRWPEGNSSKREWAGFVVQSDFLSPFPHSGDVKPWRFGRGAQIFLSAVLTVCCSLLMSDLAEPNQTVLVQLLLTLVHLVLSLVQPVLFLVPTIPLPRPTLPPPNIFFIFMLLCVVLYCFGQTQSSECLFIVHGHVWKDLELFIKIGISYFSIFSN